jgi:DnaK suppressor protein
MSENSLNAEVWRRRLLSQRAEVTDQLKAIRHGMEDHGDERRDVGDTFDAVERESRTLTDTALAAQYAQNLRAINEALERIDRGEYGICRDCTKEIAPKRLAARPFAERCLSCQEIHEQQKAVNFVNNLPAPIFSRMLRDGLSDNEQAS